MRAAYPLTILLVMIACRGPRQNVDPDPAPAADGFSLILRSNHLLDVNIFVLHDGQGTAMPERNPLSLSPLASEPVRPFNIQRDAGAPILTATELTSFAYQEALKGTPWEYYRLVMTKWSRLDGK